MTSHLFAAAERRSGDPAPLTIERVNPLEHAADIKQLFLAHERPEFPAYFDRAYPDAVADGACSWVGRDRDGRLCAHVAQFPRRFWWGRHLVRGALLGNLMVASAYRRFWPALALIRAVVRDLTASGSADFLYADPNETALPVCRAAGLAPVGALQRCVLPLADRRTGVALGIRAYRLLRRLKTGLTRIELAELPVDDVAQGHDLSPAEDARSLRPIRHQSLYRGRLAGYPDSADRWYVFHTSGSHGTPVARALVRGPDDRGVVTLAAWQCEPLRFLPATVVALGDRLRALGGARFEVTVMAGSHVERDMRRAGFLPRPERIPVLALAFSPLGGDVVAAASEWRILPVDLDR
jgi:hypothetical protein